MNDEVEVFAVRTRRGELKQSVLGQSLCKQFRHVLVLERTLVAQLHLLAIARNTEVGLLKHWSKLLNKSGARLKN